MKLDPCPSVLAKLMRQSVRSARRRQIVSPMPVPKGGVTLIAKLAIGGFLMSVLETLSAKMRIFRVPEFLAGAFLLAVIGILVHFLLGA